MDCLISPGMTQVITLLHQLVWIYISYNISIEDYKIPFTTGSKFSKGGVAIYAKDNLNTTEHDDLIEINDSFEAIWIEINMVKTKNIICGCIYRHPNTDISIYENYISKCLRLINREKKTCYFIR